MNGIATGIEGSLTLRSKRRTIEEQAKKLAMMPGMLTVINLLPYIILVLNQNRQIVFANEVATKLLHRDRANSVLGLLPGDLLDCNHAFEHVGGCGTTKFCASCGSMNAILATQRGVQDRQECQIIQNSGDALDLRVWAFPIKVSATPFSLVVMQDTSDEKRRRALERIFFHDIVNTVSGIATLSDLLLETVADVKMGYWNSEVVNRLSKISNRLIDEVNGQRQLTDAESGELAVNIRQINSIKFLQGVVDQYAKLSIAEGKSIIIDAGTNDVTIASDTGLLGRVIGNMIKNALEVSEKGGAVTVGCETVGDDIQFWVHNQGFIQPEVQLQIFRRSFSTKDSGRGLGTHSMRLLSERYLKGKVTFTTSEDRGTMFMARYPKDLSSC